MDIIRVAIRGEDEFELPPYGTTVQGFPLEVSFLILKEEKQIRLNILTASIQKYQTSFKNI